MRLLRILTVTVGLGCFGLAAGGAGCNPVSDFQCSTTENCIAEGAGGVCEANNFCTFPDAACPTGKRWHDRASSLAGMCFGDEGVGATDTEDFGESSGEPGTTDDPTTGADATTSSSTSGNPLTTGDPTTGDPTTGDPTTGDPSTTGGSSGTGAMAACDDMYGGAADYMLCEEAADSCRFAVTVTMTSCTSVCEAFGGACIGGQLNEKPVCTSTGDITCEDTSSNTVICICSR